VTATQLAGGFGLVEARALTGRIEESFVRRLWALPEDTRRLLLVAAADPVGDPLLLWRAAEMVGVGPGAAGAAETDGLLAIGEWVTFRHPLVRSAMYGSAEVEDRRAVHLALAEATDPEVDPDRRAWHLAAAAVGPDEHVALELERSAGRAQARGGLAATAAFLQRATTLTADPARRAGRALAAAEASLQAGAFDAALRLVAAAEAGRLDSFSAHGSTWYAHTLPSPRESAAMPLPAAEVSLPSRLRASSDRRSTRSPRTSCGRLDVDVRPLAHRRMRRPKMPAAAVAPYGAERRGGGQSRVSALLRGGSRRTRRHH
jgi:hypothetical protein